MVLGVLCRGTDFLKKRALLQLYRGYRHGEAILDALWHSREMTENLLKNIAAVAVAVSDLDKRTVRCQALKAAKCYMKSKTSL